LLKKKINLESFYEQAQELSQYCKTYGFNSIQFETELLITQLHLDTKQLGKAMISIAEIGMKEKLMF